MPFEHSRVIVYHKQATSARTLFISVANSVCLFGGLPAASRLKSASAPPAPPTLLTAAQDGLGLAQGSLELDPEFSAVLATSGPDVPVFLARYTGIDPPHGQVALHGGRFIPLTEARGYPPAELELLRQAYALIMEG